MHFALSMPMARLVPQQTGSRAGVVRTMVEALDRAGVAAGLTSEHPAPSAHWLRTDPTAHDCVDPLTALAFVAACSDRLKVFTNVLVLPYRNPFLTAKASATLQILSDNRLLLGVGAGYQKEEFDALGVSFAERGMLMDEAIRTIRLAWAGGEVTMKGRHFEAPGNEPRPTPDPAPPIWVGGGSDRAIERAALLGDGWAPYFAVPTNDPIVRRSAVVSVEHLAEKIARLSDLRAHHGRSGRFDLAVSPPFRPREATAANARRFLDEVHQLAGLGVTWIWTSLPQDDLGAYLEMVDWFGAEIIAAADRDASAT